MKTFKLKTLMPDGTLVDESIIQIKEGQLLLQILPEKYSLQDAKRFHEHLKNAVNNPGEIFTMPNNVQLKVLEIG